MADMVVINGVRYRREDAERLGLLSDEPETEPEALTTKKARPRNKARTAKNKSA